MMTCWARVRCVDEASQIWFHCGQTLRLVRSMPEANRPQWWAAAVYRVALIMWTTSIVNTDSSSPMSPDDELSLPDKPFAIDAVAPEHGSIVRYLKYREGVPVLSKLNGNMLPLTNPTDLLKHCLEILDGERATMRFTSGIKGRLARLIERL